MNNKYFILGEVYTNDKAYWESLLKRSNIKVDVKPNKLFYNNIPIEQLSNEEFADLVKEYIKIINQRPHEKINIGTRYEIIVNSIKQPGLTYEFPPYRLGSEFRISVIILGPDAEERKKAVINYLAKDIIDFINSCNIPKDLSQKLLYTFLKAKLTEPGSEEYLESKKRFWMTLKEVVNLSDPKIDILQEEYKEALKEYTEKHKQALPGTIKELTCSLKRLKKLNRLDDVNYIEAKISRLRKSLEEL